MKGRGRGQQEGGGGDEKAVFKGFVMASTGLRLLRVYCKSRPHAREGRGRGDGQEQGTSNKPKTVSISDGTPPDDRIPADRKTTGQRRFWKIGSVGITKLHMSSVQTGLGISFARVTVVSKLFGGKNNPPHGGERFHLLLVYHSIFLSFFFWHSFFFPPPLSGIRACQDGNQTMHCLAAGFTLPRWNILGGNHSFPLWCDCVYTFVLNFSMRITKKHRLLWPGMI